jgi:hypothetical protein
MEKLRHAPRPEVEIEVQTPPPSGVGPEAGTVHVSSGLMTESFELVGLTVEQVRSMLGRAYNLDPNAEATVNEMEARPGQRLQAGDRLEFGRLLGEKGGVT